MSIMRIRGNWKRLFLVLSANSLSPRLHTDRPSGLCHLLGFPFSWQHVWLKWAATVFWGHTVMTCSALMGSWERTSSGSVSSTRLGHEGWCPPSRASLSSWILSANRELSVYFPPSSFERFLSVAPFSWSRWTREGLIFIQHLFLRFSRLLVVLKCSESEF